MLAKTTQVVLVYKSQKKIKMNCIFRDEISEFVKLKVDDILSVFNENFKSTYGEYPEIDQQNAWKSSVIYLQEVLNDKELYN